MYGISIRVWKAIRGNQRDTPQMGRPEKMTSLLDRWLSLIQR